MTYAASDHFCVNDGRDVDNGSGHLGIKIQATGLIIPPENSYVVVTGICSSRKAGDGFCSLLRARSQTDVAAPQ